MAAADGQDAAISHGMDLYQKADSVRMASKLIRSLGSTEKGSLRDLVVAIEEHKDLLGKDGRPIRNPFDFPELDGKS